MILKVVTHTLKPGKQQAFAKWFAQTKQWLQQSPGFINAVYLENEKQPEKIVFLMYFEDAAALNHWVNSQQHEHALANLKPIIAKPWEIETLHIQ
jgi:heme-degrading monooxygenase HmoA